MKIRLPIDDFLPEIKTSVLKNQNLVITAEPGAGKTTRIAPALFDQVEGEIWMLEPRRLAAIASAQRIAEENIWQVGNEVGYQVRLENRVSEKTKIKIVTEAILNKRIANDPELKGIGLIILDEFHERSIHADLALGLLKETQFLYRNDLKIIVMSATIDTELVATFLETEKIIKVPGRTFPVTSHNIKESQITNLSPMGLREVASRIKSAWIDSGSQKTTLAFLPGSPEINFVFRQLEDWAQNVKLELAILHGQLGLDQQRAVLAPSDRRRLILTTNIAETSLTIDGVDTVIDCGLAKVAQIDNRTGFSRLETRRISKASARQRQGRAGRQFAGKCFKLWNKMDELSFVDFDKPEVLRVDLAETLLTLASLGQTNFLNFSWFEKPLEVNVKQAWQTLHYLKAIDNNSLITEQGRKMLQLPLPIRLAKIVMVGEELGVINEAVELAAILNERDFLADTSAFSSLDTNSDALVRHWVFKNEPQQIPRATLTNIKKTVEQIQGIYRKMSLPSSSKSQAASADLMPTLRLALFLTYADRTCVRRFSSTGRPEREGSALMQGRRGVQLSPQSQVLKSDYFVALDGVESQQKDTQVSIASGVEVEWIRKYFSDEIQKHEEIEFDRETNKIFQKKGEYWGSLPVGKIVTLPCPPDVLRDRLPEVIRSEFEVLIANNESARRWLERWDFFTEQKTNTDLGFNIFNLQTQTALSEQLAIGESSFENITLKDWTFHIESLVPSKELKQFHETVPDKIRVPSGSFLLVRYPKGQEAFIEVRLQEIFGWSETPKVGPNKSPILIHLLAPNYRPVQVTKDLESFWQNGYFEVRKELKIKYPKHSWPENPLEATAVAKGRPQKNK
jgi:ATP-dependent helicase HrpB